MLFRSIARSNSDPSCRCASSKAEGQRVAASRFPRPCDIAAQLQLDIRYGKRAMQIVQFVLVVSLVGAGAAGLMLLLVLMVSRRKRWRRDGTGILR